MEDALQFRALEFVLQLVAVDWPGFWLQLGHVQAWVKVVCFRVWANLQTPNCDQGVVQVPCRCAEQWIRQDADSCIVLAMVQYVASAAMDSAICRWLHCAGDGSLCG